MKNSVYGDVLTYLRILGAKKWRESEETRAGRLDNIVPGLGLFHFLWELQKVILITWWGNHSSVGTLSSLRNLLGHTLVDRDGKKFNSCDEFLFEVVRVKVVEVSALVNDGVSGLEKDKGTLQGVTKKVVEFIFKSHQDEGNRFLASFLQAGLLYVEV